MKNLIKEAVKSLVKESMVTLLIIAVAFGAFMLTSVTAYSKSSTTSVDMTDTSLYIEYRIAPAEGYGWGPIWLVAQHRSENLVPTGRCANRDEIGSPTMQWKEVLHRVCRSVFL